MRISHILYKVEDKEEAIKYFEDLGFTVVPGGFNHNIWLEDESFIEIISMKKSRILIALLKLFGRGGMASKFEYFQNADYGFIEYALDTEATDLNKENSILDELGYRYNSFEMKKRKEKGEKLKWKITFPFDLNIPFYCGDIENYKENRKPKKIEHKNGTKGLKKLVWGVPKEYIEPIKRLCDDPRLELVEGNGFQKIVIEGLKEDVFDQRYYK